jgi:23S rRNA (uracil1939-C5)-methyltransferase
MLKNVQALIESLAFKGYGVARINGKVIFIPFALTGDKAWIEVVEEKKKYSVGRLIQIVDPSPWRVNPPCLYFEMCGGCQWQHIDDSIQGEFKKEILKDVLKRIGRLREIPPITVLPSPRSYGYRTRIHMRIKGKTVGYYQEKSHRIVDIKECPIAHSLANQMLRSLRKVCPSFSNLKEVEINVSPDEDKGVFIFRLPSLDQRSENVLWESLRNPVTKGVVFAKKEGPSFYGDPSLNFVIPFRQGRDQINLPCRISPGSFSQINLEQNQTLIHTVLQFSEINQEGRVLDLYSGVGNFTLPLAIRAKEALGIEENRMAIEDARFNAEKNGIKNCGFIQGRVQDVLMRWKREKPDLIVLDPPRTGCKTILNQVARLNPKKIVYVSCEPATFSRDLRLFSEKGYQLQRLCLLDMFPQTYHMEVLGLLTQPQVKV